MCALLFCFLIVSIRPATSVKISIDATVQECFVAQGVVGTSCVVEFEVVAGASLDVDLFVQDIASGSVVYEVKKKQQSRIAFQLMTESDHRICFGNRFSTVTAKQVEINVECSGDPRSKRLMAIAAQSQGVQLVEKELAQLLDNVQAVLHEMNYQKSRIHAHDEVTATTNSRYKLRCFSFNRERTVRIKFSFLNCRLFSRFFSLCACRVAKWSMLEACVVIGLSIFQIWWIRA
jgi:hypothetical protein